MQWEQRSTTTKIIRYDQNEKQIHPSISGHLAAHSLHTVHRGNKHDSDYLICILSIPFSYLRNAHNALSHRFFFLFIYFIFFVYYAACKIDRQRWAWSTAATPDARPNESVFSTFPSDVRWISHMMICFVFSVAPPNRLSVLRKRHISLLNHTRMCRDTTIR